MDRLCQLVGQFGLVTNIVRTGDTVALPPSAFYSLTLWLVRHYSCGLTVNTNSSFLFLFPPNFVTVVKYT